MLSRFLYYRNIGISQYCDMPILRFKLIAKLMKLKMEHVNVTDVFVYQKGFFGG
jgi:hypothetical protein